MRYVLFVTLFAALTASLQAQDTPVAADRPLPEYWVFGEPASEADAEAVAHLMATFRQAWGAQDIDALIETYAPDAEWINAFGAVRRGHDELRGYFSSLFERFDAAHGAEEAARSAPISLRYLGPDVAVVHNVTESTRGLSRTGDDTRWNHITYVLHRRGDGWRIAHQMIMDARQ